MDPTGDLSFLPSDVAQAARIEPNGEVAWPLANATVAINALAGAGRIILGLDVRRYQIDGRRVSEIAWSSYEPSPDLTDHENAVAGQQVALESLTRRSNPAPSGRMSGIEEFGDWVLVTWK